VCEYKFGEEFRGYKKHVKYLHRWYISKQYVMFEADPHDILLASDKFIKPKGQNEDQKDYEERVFKHVKVYYITIGQGKKLYTYYKGLLSREIESDCNLFAKELKVSRKLFMDKENMGAEELFEN